MFYWFFFVSGFRVVRGLVWLVGGCRIFEVWVIVGRFVWGIRGYILGVVVIG